MAEKSPEDTQPVRLSDTQPVVVTAAAVSDKEPTQPLPVAAAGPDTPAAIPDWLLAFASGQASSRPGMNQEETQRIALESATDLTGFGGLTANFPEEAAPTAADAGSWEAESFPELSQSAPSPDSPENLPEQTAPEANPTGNPNPTPTEAEIDPAEVGTVPTSTAALQALKQALQSGKFSQVPALLEGAIRSEDFRLKAAELIRPYLTMDGERSDLWQAYEMTAALNQQPLSTRPGGRIEN